MENIGKAYGYVGVAMVMFGGFFVFKDFILPSDKVKNIFKRNKPKYNSDMESDVVSKAKQKSETTKSSRISGDYSLPNAQKQIALYDKFIADFYNGNPKNTLYAIKKMRDIEKSVIEINRELNEIGYKVVKKNKLYKIVKK